MRSKSGVLIALASLCVLASLYPVIRSFRSAPLFVQIWRGYYTLLVPDSEAPAKVLKRLEGAGIRTLSSENSPVTFNNFSSETTVAVAELEQRLDPADPRYDPYLKGVAQFFHQGSRNIFYLHLQTPPPFAYLVLSRALHGVPWQLADFNWRSAVLCTAVFLLTVVFATTRTRRPLTTTAALLAGGLPWLAAPLNGDYLGTLAASLLFVSWASIVEIGQPLLRYYLEHRTIDRERLRSMGGIGFAALFAATVLGGLDPRILPFLAQGGGCSLLLTVGLVVYELYFEVERAHSLFFPVLISARRPSWRATAARGLTGGWIILLLLLSPLLLVVSRHGDVEIPTPVVYPGATRDGWLTLARVWQIDRKGQLPNLADYLAHRAYQVGLPYGMKYSFPSPGERVYEQTYTQVGAKIESSDRTRERFDQAWFDRTLSTAQGVARMIEQQPGTVLPTKRLMYDVGYPVSVLLIFWLITLAVSLPATFVRRERGFETVARLSQIMRTVSTASPVRLRRIPEAPWRRNPVGRPSEEIRDLVPGAVGESDR